jgi:hypothetical protein
LDLFAFIIDVFFCVFLSWVQTIAMKFILKHGKTDKDIHNLRQEIEVTADVFLHGLQIWAIFCKKNRIVSV